MNTEEPSLSLLLWSVLFCAIGLGYLTYGRRQNALVPWVMGVALILMPFVIPTLYPLLLVCAVLIAIPYFVRY
jgi:cell division protein FtsL